MAGWLAALEAATDGQIRTLDPRSLTVDSPPPPERRALADSLTDGPSPLVMARGASVGDREVAADGLVIQGAGEGLLGGGPTPSASGETHAEPPRSPPALQHQDSEQGRKARKEFDPNLFPASRPMHRAAKPSLLSGAGAHAGDRPHAAVDEPLTTPRAPSICPRDLLEVCSMSPPRPSLSLGGCLVASALGRGGPGADKYGRFHQPGLPPLCRHQRAAAPREPPRARPARHSAPSVSLHWSGHLGSRCRCRESSAGRQPLPCSTHGRHPPAAVPRRVRDRTRCSAHVAALALLSSPRRPAPLRQRPRLARAPVHPRRPAATLWRRRGRRAAPHLRRDLLPQARLVGACPPRPSGGRQGVGEPRP